jgi:hypothetical protein
MQRAILTVVQPSRVDCTQTVAFVLLSVDTKEKPKILENLVGWIDVEKKEDTRGWPADFALCSKPILELQNAKQTEERRAPINDAKHHTSSQTRKILDP